MKSKRNSAYGAPRKARYRSGYEERVAKANPDAEHEPKEPTVRYVLTKRYIPDFVLPNGVIVEAKGFFEPKDRTKMIQVKKQNPNLDIRMLFQDANKRLTKSNNSKMYWQWCEQHGFLWEEGTTIPEEWYV